MTPLVEKGWAVVEPNVLYPPGRRPDEEAEQPEPVFFTDLNLDQIVAGVTSKQPRYLVAMYRRPLSDLDSLTYRYEVFADLERADIGGMLRSFAARRLTYYANYRVKELRDDDGGKQHYYRSRFFLNTVRDYVDAVRELADLLKAANPGSRAFQAVGSYLDGYVSSAPFLALCGEIDHLESGLTEVRYVVVLRGDRVTVAGYDGEDDYGERIAATFARFSHHAADSDVADRDNEWDAYAGIGVLGLVARLYPDLFGALDEFCDRRRDYLDPVVGLLDHDLPFYLAYLDYIAPLRAVGLTFSSPLLSDTDKTERALDTFDLALARKLHSTQAGSTVVCNDLTLNGAERMIVISGPNNGGKTTTARVLGQLHYLALLGCPVPGRDIRLFLCDQIFTHFERTEDSTTMTGRLQAELNRLRDDLAVATPRSLFILNEVFTSTTAADALYLSRQILGQVAALDALCVCVTFLDELATFDETTVSMVSTVLPEDPSVRTHKVVRRAADGRAYAHAIADKYGLGFDRLVGELNQ